MGWKEVYVKCHTLHTEIAIWCHSEMCTESDQAWCRFRLGNCEQRLVKTNSIFKLHFPIVCISGSVHSCWLNSPALTRPPAPWSDIPLNQSHYPDTEPTSSPFPILIMPSAWLGSDEYQFLSHWFDLSGNQTPDLAHAKCELHRFAHHACFLS